MPDRVPGAGGPLNARAKFKVEMLRHAQRCSVPIARNVLSRMPPAMPGLLADRHRLWLLDASSLRCWPCGAQVAVPYPAGVDDEELALYSPFEVRLCVGLPA